MTSAYAAAFATQLASLHARIAAGMPRCGWKVGINVPEVQAKLGLEHSLVGWLDGERIFPSGAGISLPADSLFHAEPELCLRLAPGHVAIAELGPFGTVSCSVAA